MADRLVSMRHDWRGLEEEVAQLKAAMSEGVLQIRAEAAARAQDAAEQVRRPTSTCTNIGVQLFRCNACT